MTGFDAFTVAVSLDPAGMFGTSCFWPTRGDDVKTQWLPTIGPPAYCMLLAFADDQRDLTYITDWTAYNVDAIADRLGVRPKRIAHTLRRLEEHRLIVRDLLESTADHPVFLTAFAAVPELSEHRFSMLPVSVRERVGGAR